MDFFPTNKENAMHNKCDYMKKGVRFEMRMRTNINLPVHHAREQNKTERL